MECHGFFPSDFPFPVPFPVSQSGGARYWLAKGHVLGRNDGNTQKAGAMEMKLIDDKETIWLSGLSEVSCNLSPYQILAQGLGDNYEKKEQS